MFDFWKKKSKSKIKPKPKTNIPSPVRTPPKPESDPTVPPPKPDIPAPVRTPPKPSTPPAKPKPKFDSSHKMKPAKSVKHQDSEKKFLDVFKQLTYRYRAWDVWKDFIVMFACALSNPLDKSHYDERETLYMKTISKYDKQCRERS